jgi:hypothetical protein
MQASNPVSNGEGQSETSWQSGFRVDPAPTHRAASGVLRVCIHAMHLHSDLQYMHVCSMHDIHARDTQPSACQHPRTNSGMYSYRSAVSSIIRHKTSGQSDMNRNADRQRWLADCEMHVHLSQLFGARRHY